ncbi:MAG: DMT family transporter, partial [Bacteroidota bacterium]
LPIFLWHFRRVDWSKTRYLLVVGLAGSFIPAFLFSIAQTELSSSLAGLLSSLTPLFTLLQAILIFGMPFAWNKVVGVTLGLVGATFLVYLGQTEGSGNIRYAVLVIMATFLYAYSSNTVKAHLQDMNPLTLSSTAFVLVGPAGLLMLFQTDFVEVVQTHPAGWLSLGYVTLLALAGTVMASFLFFWLVQLTNPVFASSVSYLIPIVALGWGALDGEVITAFHLIGMVLILIGVYLSRR